MEDQNSQNNTEQESNSPDAGVFLVSEESKVLENASDNQEFFFDSRGVKRDKKTGRIMAGYSGNIDGKPKGLKNWDTYVTEGLKKLAELNDKDPEDLDIELIAKYLEMARKGDFRALQDLFNRRFGKPRESIDHTSMGEKIGDNTIEWVFTNYREDA